MLDLIARGGRVLTPGTVTLLDFGIEGEQIVAVAEPRGRCPIMAPR